uniref:Uncharacterized protein n=1 Tax=Anopheles coluzzii TaxID=1518534 RepID=A0A8W7PD56_ANOCL
MAVAACLKATQSTVVYSGQHQPLHLVGMNGVGNVGIAGGHLQSQLTRSLERILEDAHLSGELKLSGRKLKDFPKAAGKYNLSDTVIAEEWVADKAPVRTGSDQNDKRNDRNDSPGR